MNALILTDYILQIISHVSCRSHNWAVEYQNRISKALKFQKEGRILLPTMQLIEVCSYRKGEHIFNTNYLRGFTQIFNFFCHVSRHKLLPFLHFLAHF